MPSWPEIWNRRSLPNDGTILDRLIRADGFDSGAGAMSEALWLKIHQKLSEIVQISENDSIFEVGCGAGAFLYPYYCSQHVVGGVDYSEALIAIARSVMNDMFFEVSDAASFQLNEFYDVIVANSVFQYFHDMAYAEKVIKKMLLSARKRVAILDVPDVQMQSISELKRKEAVPVGEYETKYAGLLHTDYEKEWFRNIARESGCSVTILDQESSSYGNSSFRFNVVLGK